MAWRGARRTERPEQSEGSRRPHFVGEECAQRRGKSKGGAIAAGAARRHPRTHQAASPAETARRTQRKGKTRRSGITGSASRIQDKAPTLPKHRKERRGNNDSILPDGKLSRGFKRNATSDQGLRLFRR
jgi:hypothetical protein